jgi:hypothetical protein
VKIIRLRAKCDLHHLDRRGRNTILRAFSTCVNNSHSARVGIEQEHRHAVCHADGDGDLIAIRDQTIAFIRAGTLRTRLTHWPHTVAVDLLHGECRAAGESGEIERIVGGTSRAREIAVSGFGDPREAQAQRFECAKPQHEQLQHIAAKIALLDKIL